MGNIQIKEARKIEESWDGSECDHPALAKEYDLGSATGDYVCKTCGESGFGSDWPERRRKAKKAS